MRPTPNDSRRPAFPSRPAAGRASSTVPCRSPSSSPTRPPSTTTRWSWLCVGRTEPPDRTTRGPRMTKEDTVSIATLGLISGDSHVNEPRDLWRENLPASLRDRALRGIKPGSDGNWELVMEGEPLGASAEAEPVRMQITDPEHRYEVMRQEGVVGECIYPSIALYVWMLGDAEVGAASCR